MTPVPLTRRQPSQNDRIKKLEDRLRRLETRRSLGNSTVSAGDLSVTNGGAFRVIDQDGHVVAIIGALPSPDFDRSDGSRQPGLAFYREDGSTAAFLGDLNAATPPYKQAWQQFDRAGNIVVADDTNGGKGLANPYVGGGVFFTDTDYTRWPRTTSGTFGDIAFGYYTVQNARLQWDILTTSDTGAAGQCRLLVNGAQVDAVQSVTTAFTLWRKFTVPLPAGVDIGSVVPVQLQARRTSGTTGSIYAIVQRFEGDQSP